ncbi:hypothetical protein RhiirA1_458159 [Rhizophagus irregularis]|uniref:Uncharacterized protein n=1 Tax=Rhizophagus irregularis TaxID=588596 RepID=A0A2N0RWI0_9GLOM|nr:hypothetical protein RhiirA1_458159 [Rhizophagus irregularis]
MLTIFISREESDHQENEAPNADDDDDDGGLELDAFFRHHRMALEVQEAQHRLHNTS